MPAILSITARFARPIHWFPVAVFLFSSSTFATAQDSAQALENTLTKLIEQAEPSVVSIAKVRQAPTELPPFHVRPFEESPPVSPENPDFQPNSFGAGIIIAGLRPNERLVLTNYHVVDGGPIYPAESADDTTLFVQFVDRRSCLASIIAADPRSDLAVLRLNLAQAKIEEHDLKPMDWSTSTPLRKGQLVVMLGNPYSLAHDGSASASWGMISNLARRPLPWTAEKKSKFMMYRLGNLVQIDGQLNLGTSGGPLLNLKGELIGLTTSLAAVEGYEKQAGFAIPLDDLTRRIVKSLVAGHEVEYGMLGVAPEGVLPSRFRELNTGLKQTSAARVADVSRDSPAERAGILKDDLILSVGEFPIHSDSDLMRVVGLHAPESKVDVLLWRRERPKPFTVEVTLGKWPVWDDERIIETSPRFAPWRGITVDYPTGRDKYLSRDEPHKRYRRAVVITKVARDSAADAAGIQPGVFIFEVNRIPVQTPAEFYEASKMLRGPVDLRLGDSGRILLGE